MAMPSTKPKATPKTGRPRQPRRAAKPAASNRQGLTGRQLDALVAASTPREWNAADDVDVFTPKKSAQPPAARRKRS